MSAGAELIATGRSVNAGKMKGIDETRREIAPRKFYAIRTYYGSARAGNFRENCANPPPNVIQPVFFVLKGTVQTVSGVASVRVVNKDIVAALNATGVYQFDPKPLCFSAAVMSNLRCWWSRREVGDRRRTRM